MAPVIVPLIQPDIVIFKEKHLKLRFSKLLNSFADSSIAENHLGSMLIINVFLKAKKNLLKAFYIKQKNVESNEI
jgi:hypothetical protein